MTDQQQTYLASTPMLDYQHPSLQQLIDRKGWRALPMEQRIGAIYNYVRDDIRFGYNRDDSLSASEVLADGYGQCNTKGTLLMALLRAVGVPARFHGFTIFNQLQKGAIPHWMFALAPPKIIHSWIEIWFDERWLEIEGYIIDQPYLQQVQRRFADQCEAFSGYGIATPCLRQPENEWLGENTYIQKEGIADDFGIYDQPDDFYQHQGTNLKGIKRWLFRYALRYIMNRNVDSIRRRGIRH